ncbi:MAG: class II aldolase/adducin family protein [Phycisphaerales bacterium]|nr:class II aldolase/adducin family protein [Phycisphaerales bacterium]
MTTQRKFVSEFKLKEEMCEYGRRIWMKGFCAGNEGNHSVRLGNGKFLVTPTGISKGFLKPDDICLVDANGKQLAGKRRRSSEFQLHAHIYKARPDVNCVIHSHPPHATAFAVAGVDLPSCIHPEAEVFLGPVHTAKYVTPGDKRLGESIDPFIKDSNTILLGNHGVVSFAEDLESTYYKLEIVDAYARILILAKEVGSIQPLGSAEMKELIELKARFGMNDPRAKDPQNAACQSDFISRVRSAVATHGRMATGAGTVPAPSTSAQCGLEQTIAHLVPDRVKADEMEQIVQVITDQIMASMG